MLYKYPQARVPVRRPASRRTAGAASDEFEYELLDTGVFDDDRYFDVFVEYAKAAPDDILIADHRAQPRPRGGAAARAADAVVPQHLVVDGRHGCAVARAARRRRRGTRASRRHPELGEWLLYCDDVAELLFSENETNNERLFGAPNVARYVKDGINDYVVARRDRRGQPRAHGDEGGRAAQARLDAGASGRVRLRLTSLPARSSAVRRRSARRRFRRVLATRRDGGRRVLRDGDRPVARRRTPPT